MEWFTTNRGYFISAALFIIGGATALHWITPEAAAVLVALVSGLGVATVQAGVKKNEEGIAATNSNLSYRIGSVRSELDDIKTVAMENKTDHGG